jgi:hypothetical protein
VESNRKEKWLQLWNILVYAWMLGDDILSKPMFMLVKSLVL